MSLIHKIPTSTVIDLKAEVPIEEDQMLSRTLVQRKDLGITLFSLDKGQEIDRHSSSGDAMVNVLSGVADITIGEACYEVAAGETISNESSPEGKLLLVLEGRLLVSLTDQTHDVKAGGLISISAHQSYHLEATTNCKYLQIEMV